MKQSLRHLIQGAVTVLCNANLPGFFRGRIWQGQSKKLCVPGLNCYSCPGALGSCPIGSLQAVFSGGSRGISFYVAGFLLFFGVVFGRLVCGFLCPFGFIQDLLHKIPLSKITLGKRIDKILRYVKYAVLCVLVIGLPMLIKSDYGVGQPWFCKYLCPAGTLEGGIPLAAANEPVRDALGGLFVYKAAILAVVIIASVFIFRPFCKYLCPLGAIYGLFNRFAFYRMNVDGGKCTRCGLCVKTCKMGVNVMSDINSAECIRCGECKSVCPHGAISSGLKAGERVRVK